MLNNLKKLVKWGSPKARGAKELQTSILLLAFITLLEDILFWNNKWLSLSFILCTNLLFFICIHWEVYFFEFVFSACVVILSIDAFEAWLKYKHRTNCLKKLASHDGETLKLALDQIKAWTKRRWLQYVYLRENNHTKAFLLINIMLTLVFLIGKYIGGYVLTYLLLMFLCVVHKIAPIAQKLLKNIQLNAESDGEIDDLIPEVSEVDIKLLSIEPEQQVMDERQSLDFWKPEEFPIEEVSDSSENSSSMVTNLSIEKMKTFDKDVGTSDSSDEEYIPFDQQKEHLQTTMEVQPSGTWSGAAYNALYNFTGAVASMVYTKPDDTKRKRISSMDSSDGFEMVDKNDLL